MEIMRDSTMSCAALDDEALYTELTAVKGIGKRMLSILCAHFRVSIAIDGC